MSGLPELFLAWEVGVILVQQLDPFLDAPSVLDEVFLPIGYCLAKAFESNHLRFVFRLPLELAVHVFELIHQML